MVGSTTGEFLYWSVSLLVSNCYGWFYYWLVSVLVGFTTGE